MESLEPVQAGSLRGGLEAQPLFLSADDSRTLTNWQLNGFPNSEQGILLGLVIGYSIIIGIFWRWQFLKPFKLITVFLHEFGHASAALCTGGRVLGMEVNTDEGGVTKTQGGQMCCILPAGYLGSSFFGMFFIIMSADSTSVQIAAGLLGVALFAVFFIADNWTLRSLCLLFIGIIAICWVLEVTTSFPALQIMVLFIGVMNSLFSIYDIHDDLISRRVNHSDASLFADLAGGSSRCWGVIWCIISIVLFILGIYIALVLES